MINEKSRPLPGTGPHQTLSASESKPDTGIGKPSGRSVAAADPISSRQVNWYETYEFATSLAKRLGVDTCPAAGTAAWRDLDDGDPAKLVGMVWAGVHGTLRTDTLQAEMAEASQQISTMANWGRVGQQIRGRQEFYAERPWLRRSAS
jgi:hypothetical protein